jgi:hypothetical protein
LRVGDEARVSLSYVIFFGVVSASMISDKGLFILIMPGDLGLENEYTFFLATGVMNSGAYESCTRYGDSCGGGEGVKPRATGRIRSGLVRVGDKGGCWKNSSKSCAIVFGAFAHYERDETSIRAVSGVATRDEQAGAQREKASGQE